MADFKIGATNHRTSTSKDAFSVSSTLTQTYAFQKIASNPLANDAFITALKSKQEAALAKNDKSMFALIGNMINAAQAERKTPTTHRFDSNDYFYA